MKVDLIGYLSRYTLFISLLLLNFESVAAQIKPTHMTFSYVDHPVIIHEVIPIVDRAYLAMGIKLTFEMHPSSRNLKAAESGIVDGDVAFSDLLLKGHDTLVIIEPPLVTSIFVLLCSPDLRCNQEVLFDDDNVIVSTDTTHKGLLSFYPQSLSRSFYTINNLSIIPKLLAQQRFQYGIYVFGGSQTLSSDIQHLKVVELFKTQTHHTVHQKYAFMKDEISAALQLSIDKTKSSLDNFTQ